MKKEIDLKKEDKKTETAADIVSSIGMSVSLSSFFTLLPSLTTNERLAIITGSTVLLSPCVYFGMNALRNKARDRRNRDMHHNSQLVLMLEEAHSADHNVTKTSTIFLHELQQEQDNLGYHLTQDNNEQMHISQFLYLVNANYYDEIKKSFPTLNREEVVRRLISLILLYLKDNNKQSFDENDAKEVLKRCLFIKAPLKEEIYQEFKKSKVKSGKNKFYEIIRKDTDSSLESYKKLRAEDEKNQAPNFDIEDLNQVYSLIGCYVNNEDMQELGNTLLDWDYDFLRKILVLISTKYRQELVKEYGQEYNNLNLAGTFIYNALSYAVVNNREMVGYKEMINCFKGWNYIPFNLQLDILDDLFEQEGIPYEEHPYDIKKKRNNKAKIIQLDFKKH